VKARAFTKLFSAASYVALVALLALLSGGAIFPHALAVSNQADGQQVAQLLKADEQPKAAIPDTDTNHMVIVSPDVATIKAGQALGSSNLNTSFNLGPATEEFVGGQMVYVFQLYFDNSRNKSLQHGIAAGYVMVNAEDPSNETAPVIQRFGTDPHTGVNYTMKVCISCGQGDELVRWVYNHGYSSYKLDDPTLEVADTGHPYFSVTLMQLQVGWEHPAPVGMVLVDANDGNIVRYDLNKVPAWIDRVYSSGEAEDLVNGWGFYRYAPVQLVGSSKAIASRSPVIRCSYIRTAPSLVAHAGNVVQQ